MNQQGNQVRLFLEYTIQQGVIAKAREIFLAYFAVL